MLSNISSTEASAKRDVASMFANIVSLEVGEALLFSPAAMLQEIVTVEDANMNGKKIEVVPTEKRVTEKLSTGWMKIRVRKRLMEDGGGSIMAI